MKVNDLRDISIEEIEDFVSNGIVTEHNKDILQYIDLMDKVRGMYNRIKDFPSQDHIIDHLIKIEGYSRRFALKLYQNAMEYFHCDHQLSKTAWRNIIAKKMEKIINAGILLAKDTSDLAKVGKMLLDVSKILQLDQPDMDELPSELFDKPFKIYTLDPEQAGIPKADRREIAAFIDQLPELTELERERIKSESGIGPMKLFLNEYEDPRNETSE